MKLLQYKGYYGSIDISVEDKCLYGKIQFIKALISYEGQSVDELEISFKDAVDDYLTICNAQGYEPETSYKGSFNVRIGSDLHREALICAMSEGLSLNDFVKQSIDKSVHHFHN